MEIKELAKADLPERLYEIPDPPKKMYIRGKTPDKEKKKLCVVGSRKYSSYGKEICEHLIGSLEGFPVTIVSGLALGIDSIAHKSALSAGLDTIAVPGSGLDWNVLYPSTNRQLAEKIIDSGGALLSEFEPKFKATVWSFPQRNRIMAGLSDAVLVIEAEKKSGTLITARLATEYNRDVLTVPGSVFSKTSEGPHLLLRLGATPITGGEDLLDALGFQRNEKSVAEKNYADCSPDELIIIEMLREPRSKEELFLELAFPISQANALLSIMELKGIIKEEMGELHLL